MNNIFNQLHSEEILNRIDKLSPISKPQWGKMNVAQMLAHCSSFQDIAMGHTFQARGWLGLFIGSFVKPMFYNDKPLAQNMSTIPTILIVDEKDFEIEKEILKQKILIFQMNGPEKCTTHPHPFLENLLPISGEKEFTSTLIII